MSTTSSSRRPSLPSSPTFPVTQTQQARDRERFIDGQRHTEGLEKVAAKRRARTLLRDYYGLAAKAGEGSREEREKEMGMNIGEWVSFPFMKCDACGGLGYGL